MSSVVALICSLIINFASAQITASHLRASGTQVFHFCGAENEFDADLVINGRCSGPDQGNCTGEGFAWQADGEDQCEVTLGAGTVAACAARGGQVASHGNCLTWLYYFLAETGFSQLNLMGIMFHIVVLVLGPQRGRSLQCLFHSLRQRHHPLILVCPNIRRKSVEGLHGQDLEIGQYLLWGYQKSGQR